MTMLGTRPMTSRLLGCHQRGPRGSGLQAHLQFHGPLMLPGKWGPEWQAGFLAEIERSGLTGRGGAGFPSARKIRAVKAAGPHPVLVVNAMEGEPASAKDRTLLHLCPHLVLDGADLVAFALQAEKVVLCLPNGDETLTAEVESALSERLRHGRSTGRQDALPVEVARLAGRYTAGEESALVAAVAGHSGVPAFRPDKSIPLSVGRRQALVHNVETLAHLAMIARYGAQWFRELGPTDAPGTCLVTVSGDVEVPSVVEVEIGTPVRQVVERAGPSGPLQAVLVGGYGGSWLSGAQASAPYAPIELRALDASMGAGVLVALGADACGLRETYRVARFMAAESAGQCGPCLFGLPAIADDIGLIADGRGDGAVLERLSARCRSVAGRGACRHPDGVARLVQSALRVFAADICSHLQGVPCRGNARPTVLQFPGEEPARL